jgi:hypothetical protein
MIEHIQITNTLQALALMQEGYHIVVGRGEQTIAFNMIDGEVYNSKLDKSRKHVTIGKTGRDEFIEFIKPLLILGAIPIATRDDELLQRLEEVIKDHQEDFL